MEKKWYKRKTVWFIAVVVIIILMKFFNNADDVNKNSGKYKIPNVFGINYSSATEVLQADGFDVKAIETDATDILDKLLYEIETVEKGNVFKIDDYVLDGNGNLNLNYDILYNETMKSNDKSIVIYYAKESYSGKNNIENNTNEDSTTNIPPTDNAEELNSETSTQGLEQKENNDNEIRADFKAAMDSYEQFFDEYVAIMKKYKDNPSDISILKDYTDYMGKYTKMMQDFEKWESEDMNSAETAYYLEVQGRITNKLLEVAQ